MDQRRLFIVSSRLPVCIDTGKEQPIRPASTKLVTAIKKYLQGRESFFKELSWVGIPGCTPTRWNEGTNTFFESPFTYLPVLVFKEQYRKYHLGFAKSVIWPLFHGSSSHAFNEDEYEQYKSVNERYAEVLEKKCWENDTIWINDYHLLPLPGMVRNKFPEAKIEFFLHIPFPSPDLFRLLPGDCKKDILKSLVTADVIHFNTGNDIENFSRALDTVLGYKMEQNVIHLNERVVEIAVLENSVVEQSILTGNS